jgi:hemerythrin-like domain-containing protein
MSPTQELMSEHRVIESVLTALEARLDHLDPFPAEFFDDALDFFKNFADGCHHYKEEIALFPAMEAHGIPREHGPIGCMLHEHEEGRACVKGIRVNVEAARAGSPDAAAAVRRFATQYIGMLREHISKEDNILFRMADGTLPPEAMEAVARRFRQAEDTAPGAHQKYVALAERLTRQAALVS